MFAFSNLNFHIEQPQNDWQVIGYKTKSNDGRIINIKPVSKKQFRENGLTVSMHATIQLTSLPTILEDTSIALPQNEMSELSNALRYYSELISVSDVSWVHISSGLPSEGFIPENENEKEYLNHSKGFELVFTAEPLLSNNFFDEIHRNQLLDRKEGVKIMANANGMIDDLSKFKELVRLFENAFGRDGDRLSNLLYDFLQTSEFEYSKEEISDWMVTKRHGATHADKRITKTLVHSGDMNSDIERIRQAAYDVLFNKKDWQSQTLVRREVFKPAQRMEKDRLVFVKSRMENGRSVELNLEDEPFYFTGVDKNDASLNNFVQPKEWWFKYFQKESFHT